MNKEEIKKLLETPEGKLALEEAMEELPLRVTPRGFLDNEFGDGSYDALREYAMKVIGEEPTQNGIPAIILTDGGGEWTEMAKDMRGAHEV